MSDGTKEHTTVPAPQDLKTKENPDDTNTKNMDTDDKGPSSTVETKNNSPTDMDVAVTATSEPKPKARKASEITPIDASAENGVTDDDTNLDADVDADVDLPKAKKVKTGDSTDDGNNVGASADNCTTEAESDIAPKVLGDNTKDEEDDEGLVSKDKDEEKVSESPEPKSTSSGITDELVKKINESSAAINSEVDVDVTASKDKDNEKVSESESEPTNKSKVDDKSTGNADKEMQKEDEASVSSDVDKVVDMVVGAVDSADTDNKNEECGKNEKSEEPKGGEVNDDEEEDKDEKTKSASASDGDKNEMVEKAIIEEKSDEAKTNGHADTIAPMPSAPDSNAAYYKEMDERKNVEWMQGQMQMQGQTQMQGQMQMQGQTQMQGQMQMPGQGQGQGQGQMPVQEPMQGQGQMQMRGQEQMPGQEPMQGQGQMPGQEPMQGQMQGQGQGQMQGQMPGPSNQQPYPGNRFPHGHGPPQHWPPPMGGHPYGQHPPPQHGFRPHPNGMNMPPQFHSPSGPYQGQGQSGNSGGRGGNGGGYPPPPNPEHGSMPPRESGGYYGGSPGSYPPQGPMPGQHQHGHGHMGPNGYGGPGPGGYPPMNNMGMYPPHMGPPHGQGHGHGGYYPPFSGQPGGPPPPYHGMNSPPGPMQQGSRGPMPSGSGPGSPQSKVSPYRGGMMPPAGNGLNPHMPGLGPSPRSRGMPGVGPSQGGPQNWGTYPNTITKPSQNDVLCGRGGATNSHPGNRAFRKLVRDFKDKYLKAKKSAKPRVAAEVVDIIRHLDPSGRFLKKDKDSDLWVEIGSDKAHEKTSQALREGAPAIRKNWDKVDDMPPIKKENKAPIGKEDVNTVETNASSNETTGKPDGDSSVGMAVVV